MMDLSDGLAGDLPKLLKPGQGASIDSKKLPMHMGTTLCQAFCDGEDFELLWTAKQEHESDFLQKVGGSLIGTVTGEDGILLDGSPMNHKWTGYVHKRQ